MKQAILTEALKYLDTFLEYQFETANIPGLVVTISRKGSPLFSKTLGYSDTEKKVRMKHTAIFRIASQSKMFTSTAIFLLLENGKVKLHDPVAKHLPWLRDSDDRRLGKATISQLLSHTAGVVRDGWENDFWCLLTPFPNREDLKRDFLRHRQPRASGDSRMKYSNHGFALLGLLIEAVSGREYGDFLAEEIFGPLSLSDTRADYGDSLKKRIAKGYTRDEGELPAIEIEAIAAKATAPAAGICSTAEDLNRFLWSQCYGRHGLLSDSSKRNQYRRRAKVVGVPGEPFYGLGFFSEKIGSRRVVGHSGSFSGHNTCGLFDPDDGLVVTVLTNSISRTAASFAKGIVRLLQFFERHTRPEIPGRGSKKFKGRFTNMWFSTDFIPLGGGKVAGISPSAGWDAFQTISEHYAVLNATDLKITATGSMGLLGEKIEFLPDDRDGTAAVRYGSHLCVPHEEYARWIKKQKRISVRGNRSFPRRRMVTSK